MKTFNVFFPLYKVGDDLGFCWFHESAAYAGIPTDGRKHAEVWKDMQEHIEKQYKKDDWRRLHFAGGLHEGDPSAAAFLAYAKQLEATAVMARRFAGLAKEGALVIEEVDTRCIQVGVEDAYIERLLAEQLIRPHDDEDEDDAYEDEDDGLEELED